MKLLLILVGFFLCASVERIGFRKFRFVFRLGVFLVFILLALLCAGCSGNPDNYHKEAQKEYFFECLSKLPVGVGSKAVEKCNYASIMWGSYKAKERNKQKNKAAP